MAQQGRELVKALAEAIGLNPAHVRKLTLEADATTAILVATVEMFPEMTPEQRAAFLAAMDANGKQFTVIIEPHEV